MDLDGVFQRHAATPLVRPVDLAVAPIEAAAALADADGFAFLDTSADQGLRAGYSVLAWAPFATLCHKGGRVEVRSASGSWSADANPFDVIDRLLSGVRCTTPDGPRVPYVGGAIGYLGYDLYKCVERYRRQVAVDDLELPDCRLGFYDAMLVYEHRTRSWHQAGVPLLASQDMAATFDRRLAELHQALTGRHGAGHGHRAERHAGLAANGPQPRSNVSREKYCEAVERAIEHIYAGDVYQVNLSQRFHAPLRTSAFELFRTLRRINPSQYGAFLSYPGHHVISASPELFLRRSGALVETRPIKGTRPRSTDRGADESLRSELESSAKDRAELSMIVDLMRNDLGRVCEYGSVEVADHRRIEALPTVFHTVSTVRGVLRNGASTVDLLRAAFPGGSVTGCPKIRAIEIIDELEPTRRNAYTGAIGYLGFDGDLCLNVAIRTMITKGADVYYQVGGGIVADSDPDAEYEETLHKGAALRRALVRAGSAADA